MVETPSQQTVVSDATVAKALLYAFGFLSFVSAILAFATDSFPYVPSHWFVTVHPTSGATRLHFGFWFSLLLMISGAAGLAYLITKRTSAWLLREEAFRRRLAEADAKEQRAAKALDQSMGALHRALQGWRTSANDNDTWRYRRVEEIYEVEKDGTTTSTRTYTIEAVRQVIGFRVVVTADQTAQAAAYPSDINFSARSIDEGAEMEWCVVENGLLSKTFALIFVPPIEPGDQRRFRVTHTWPRFVGDLISRGESEFVFDFASAEEDDVAEVDMEFSFAAELPPLRFEMGDPSQAGVLTMRQQGLEHPRQIWTYRAAALPMNRRKYVFKVRPQ